MGNLRTVLLVMLLMAIVATGSVTYAVSEPQQGVAVISVSGAIQIDTGFELVPAQGLRVELRDDDAPYSHGPGDLLATTVTDEFGRYAFDDISNLDIDGPENRRAGGQDVRLIIVTDNDHVAVESLQRRPYRWASDTAALLGARGLVANVPDGAHIEFPTMQFDDDVDDFQAIRAFVALNQGWSFLADALTELNVENPDPGRTVARWPTLLTTERGYDPEEQVITLTTGDADFPDAVLFLQGHAFFDNALRNQGSTYPAACVELESLRDETSPTCAWIHGLSLFFATAVQDDPAFVTASEAFSLEPLLVDLANGDTVSARIGAALWDLMDEPVDGFDQFSTSFAKLWDPLTSTALLSFREYWDAWVVRGEEGEFRACEALPSLFQNTINYNTPPQLDALSAVTIDEDPDTPITIDLKDFARDAECPFEMLMIDVQEPPADTVTVRIDEEGVLEVMPVPDWHGEITLPVRVFDGVDYVVQELQITVRSINDAPRIATLPDRAVKVGQDIIYQLEDSISDPDHDKSQLTLGVEVSPSTVLMPRIEWEIDQDNFIVRFSPRQEDGQPDLRPGANAVDIVVTDPEGASDRYTLLLTWEQLPNEAPVIDSAMPLVWEARKGQIIEMNLLAFATDDRQEPGELGWCIDFDTLEHATISGCGTQKLTFTPDPANFLGDDEITLIVQDADAAENKVDVILRWTPEPNILPFINPPIPDFTAGINQQLVVDLSPFGHDLDDTDIGLRWYVRFFDPEAPNPFVSGQGGQRLTFTPVVDFEGTVIVEFVVRDPKGGEAEQTVRLTWQKYNTYMPLLRRPFAQKDSG